MRYSLIIAISVFASSCDEVVEKDVGSTFDPVIDIKTSDLKEKGYTYLDK